MRHDPSDEMQRLTLSEHLEELRGRVLWSVIAIGVGMLVSFFFHRDLKDFMLVPFEEAIAATGAESDGIATIDPGEGFLQVLKLCFITGFVLAAPVVLWQLWGFIAAGLYAHERRWVRVFFPVSLVLFAAGLVAAYLLLIPFGMRFLIGWDVDLAFNTSYRLSSYLSTCLTMLFAMGLVFQLPLVMLFLQASDIVRRETLQKGWRVAVLLSFVLGMMLTDPSPVTQVVMAVPVVGLYFLGLWGGQFVGLSPVPWRWWKAWPIVLAVLIYIAMIVYRRELNELAVDMFA